MFARVVPLVLLLLFGCLATASSAGASPSHVTVPLDWSGKRSGKLKLNVGVTGEKGPLLLYLAGGPGQSAAQHVDYVKSWFDYLAPDYRVVVMDQRGTGGTAINCRRIQRLPLTDLTVRPRAAVRACGKQLGNRRSFYSTTATVRDMEAVRKAFGVQKMAVMGTSYGTYVGTRYARAFPNRVSRLILDSVVPQADIDPFLRVHMRRAAKVLRWECGKAKCGFRGDPAADLARLVAMPPRREKVPGKNLTLRVDGPALIDWLTTIFSFKPADVPKTGKAIHTATKGNYRPLMRMAGVAQKLAAPTPADQLSWGLHAATLCSDAAFPFSIARGDRRSRSAASQRFLARSPDRSFWPFNRETALGNGIPQVCFDWPKTKVASPPKPGRIVPPTLILAGQYDLSTPVEYARRELRRTRKGKLVVVPKAGHAVAFQRECSMKALSNFLAAKWQPHICRGSKP